MTFDEWWRETDINSDDFVMSRLDAEKIWNAAISESVKGEVAKTKLTHKQRKKAQKESRVYFPSLLQYFGEFLMGEPIGNRPDDIKELYEEEIENGEIVYSLGLKPSLTHEMVRTVEFSVKTTFNV